MGAASYVDWEKTDLLCGKSGRMMVSGLFRRAGPSIMRRSEYGGGYNEPLTSINGFPVYATTVIAGMHLFFFMVSAIVGAGTLTALFAMHPELVFKGMQFWRPLTYGFANEITDFGAIWFVIALFFFYYFGKEVEAFLGRPSFLFLYTAIWLSVPVVQTLLWWLVLPQAVAGSSLVHLGCFVAFAAIYPGAQLLFGIPAKWFAVGIVAITVLQTVGARDGGAFLNVAAAVGTAFVLTLWLCGRLELPIGDRMTEGLRGAFARLSPAGRRRAKFKVVKDAPVLPERKASGVGDLTDVDAILDKIASRGLASLTRRERELLEKARNQLIEREKE